MYTEFKYPIYDYFKTLNRSEFIYEIIFPLLCGGVLFIIFNRNNIDINYSSFVGYGVALMAILIGFSITSLTVLSTASGKTIDDLKSDMSERFIHDAEISKFKLMYINFVFTLISEILALLSVSFFFVVVKCGATLLWKNIILSLNISLILHVILLNLRNITNFYLVFTRDATINNTPTTYSKKSSTGKPKNRKG